MNRKTKIWLVTAFSLVFLGCMIFGGTMALMKWDFTKLSTFKYETNEHSVDESFTNIFIVTDTADIKFVPSNNGKTTVICYEQEGLKHSVAVVEDTLMVEIVDNRKWYEYISIGFASPEVTIYIPQGGYGNLSIKSCTGDVEIPKDFKFERIEVLQSTGAVTNLASASGEVKIKTSTGDICVENITAVSLELTASTGKIYAFDVICDETLETRASTGKTELNNVKCKAFISNGNTGDIYLKNLIANERILIERSTGSVRFDSCDAGEISVKTDTGNVRGTLITEKVFITNSDTGRIDVPKTINGGRCEITTDTGNIKISLD